MDVNVSTKIETFFAQYRLRHYDKYHILLCAGDVPPGVFHLVTGQVRQYDITEQGDEIVLNVFKPPAFFPMTWAINKTPNRYFLQTSMASSIRVAPPDDVTAFLRANLDVTYDLLSRLFTGADGMQQRMAYLMGGSGRSRVIFELVVECKRFGQPQPDGTYLLPLHEDELARRAGLSRETANRELAKLKTMDLIDITHKEIIIKDPKRLENELEAKP